jgi:Tol biopolymer transport system component/DNA-binding winged helix-turn-helix (wHTH) protein
VERIGLMIAASKRAVVSFGTFEVDLDAGEIRKAGLRVRLQGQPFRVLAALLSKPGEVVTREQLQHEIWGDNTTVDFERGIASAINKIRDALGDSAENPLYIETLAKRGYRFIAPVVFEEPQAQSQLHAAKSDAAVVAAVSEVQAHEGGTAASEALATAGSISAGKTVPARARFWPLQTIALLAMGALLLVGLTALTTYRLSGLATPLRPPRIQQLTTSGVIYNGPPNNETHLRLVTDGARIYTSFLVGGRSQLSSMNLGGTEIQPVTLPEELGTVSIADISSDGSRLIVRGQNSRDAEQPLWIVPTTGGSALRVGAVLAHDATFMPRGDSLLFASGNRLGIVRLDDGTETTYATLLGRAFWPRWSPDGKTLRFTLMDPVRHSSSLWELDATHRRAHPLDFPGLAGMSLCCGSWMTDGSAYVFEASNMGESNIWSVGAGAHPRLQELTNGPLHFVAPLPARGDSTLYFVGIEQPADNRLYDQKLHRFVPAPEYLGAAGKVMYSRDNRWVAWTDTSGHLWRARSADGSDRLRLTEDDLEVFLAQWSPDGQQLALMARKPGETWQIYTVGATGGAVHLLLADQRNLADPDWSADGKSIVFGRQAELMGKESGPNLIQTLDLTTHAVRSLPGSENLFSPRWSPDGHWIIALSIDQTRLVLYDVQRGSWRTLFTGSVADPVWSSDSRSIFFHASAEPNSEIMRIPLDGPAQLIADPSRAGLPSDNYRFSGVTPDGAPIVEPGIGTGNMYSVSLPH